MDAISDPNFNLTLLNISERIQADPNFPDHRRSSVLSSVRCVVRWLGKGQAVESSRAADDMVLTEGAVDEMFRGFAPGALGVSRKRLRNAQSDFRFALRFCGPAIPRPLAARSEPVRAIERMVSDRFAKMGLRRFLRYLACHGINPWAVTNADAEAFRQELSRDRNVPWARRIARQAINAWNKEQARNPEWPQTKLALRDTRPRWGLPWSAFPVDFQRAVDEF
ncbi:unnamed protein product, partial [Phaeothamnion confervicola]